MKQLGPVYHCLTLSVSPTSSLIRHTERLLGNTDEGLSGTQELRIKVLQTLRSMMSKDANYGEKVSDNTISLVT